MRNIMAILLPAVFGALILSSACGGGGGNSGGGGGNSSPTISQFAPAKTPITRGNGTTLLAQFTGGSGTIDRGVGAVVSGTPVSTGPLAADTTFTLTVTNAAGNSTSRVLTIPVVPAPMLIRFFATPSVIQPGGSAILKAEYSSGVATVDHGLGTLPTLSPCGITGPGVGTGPLAADTTYQVTVTNAAGDSITGTFPVRVATGAFTATGSMAVSRSGHTASLLADGQVLATGGGSGAERWDPATGQFSPAGAMVVNRIYHTATVLADGRVLLVGGAGSAGLPLTVLASAEIYDPDTNTFTATGPLVQGRAHHTATLLPDGGVLVAGGTNGIQALGSMERFDPTTGKFSGAGGLISGRSGHTATLLGDGTVLLAGGEGLSSGPFYGEIYTPGTQTSARTAGPMVNHRAWHTATLLDNGTVLIAGSMYVSTAERYDPATGKFISAGAFANPYGSYDFGFWGSFELHTATKLPSGRVLITGGFLDLSGGDPGGCDTLQHFPEAYLYDADNDAFTPTGSMTLPRSRHTATLLPSGKVLVAGGDTKNGGTQSVDLYDPQGN